MTTTQSTTDNLHYVTREEANSKLCPNGMNYDGTCWCAGPKCMAWRWASSFVKDKDGQIGDLNGNGYVQVFSETHGYCGMVQS